MHIVNAGHRGERRHHGRRATSPPFNCSQATLIRLGAPLHWAPHNPLQLSSPFCFGIILFIVTRTMGGGTFGYPFFCCVSKGLNLKMGLVGFSRAPLGLGRVPSVCTRPYVLPVISIIIILVFGLRLPSLPTSPLKDKTRRPEEIHFISATTHKMITPRPPSS